MGELLPIRGRFACVVCEDHGCEFCPGVRGVERAASLSASPVPAPEGAWPLRLSEEEGSAQARVLLVLAGLAAVALAVWLLWPYMVAALVAVTGFRVATRGTRRRRPKSSWSSLGRTAALMYAAWNSRWLKGVQHKVTVGSRAVTAPDEHSQSDVIPY